MTRKQVGVLGSGQVGQTLAAGFLEHGYEVMLGSRSPKKLADWQARHAGAQTGDFAQTAAFGELVVLAVKGGIAAEALGLAGAENLAGKTVIDTTNPLADAPPENGVIKFFTSLDRSLMEHLQADFPGAHLVKAFSCIGNAQMVNPDYGAEKPSMFICGNDAAAKAQVSEIVELFGFEAADMGGAESARAIEPLCMLWCIPGFKQNSWNHAFRLIRP